MKRGITQISDHSKESFSKLSLYPIQFHFSEFVLNMVVFMDQYLQRDGRITDQHQDAHEQIRLAAAFEADDFEERDEDEAAARQADHDRLGQIDGGRFGRRGHDGADHAADRTHERENRQQAEVMTHGYTVPRREQARAEAEGDQHFVHDNSHE